jgi:D-arabinose 1-dehydrogenase-like Zn-dependent alcohol dehydrogenase
VTSAPLMRAARLDVATRALVVKDVPRPRPAYGEVLVRVAAAGVCLSDVHIVQGLIIPRRVRSGELTLGHEVAGTVAAPGAGVDGWPLGRRVVLQPIVARKDGNHTLGMDYNGGWADYVVTPAATLVPIPDSLPFAQAAIIPDAVSTPWSAITATAAVRPGQGVGIWGVGGLGAHAVQLARLVGAAPVIAVDPLLSARERALDLGADAALDPSAADFGRRLLAVGRGQLLDVAMDFAGVPAAQRQILESLAPGGKAVLVGLSGVPVTIEDSTSFSVYAKQVLGHFGSQYADLPQLIRLAELGRLDLSRSVTEIMSLEDAAEAVRRLDAKVGDPFRIVLRPERASETG